MRPAGKILLTLLVISLYLLPLSQNSALESLSPAGDLESVPSRGEGDQGPQAPFFSEHFVNEAQPGVMCHVSSLALAGDRRLLCTWYAGSREAASDVALYAAFFDLEHGTWSPPAVLLTPKQSSRELRRYINKLGNALIFNDGQGNLWLFYAAMAYGGWSTTSLHYKLSQDGGQTWSPSRKLLLSPFFNLTSNLKNQGLNLVRGGFLLPLYHEFIHKFSQLLFCLPGNRGLHYELWRLTSEVSAIQPALVSDGGPHLTAFFRNAGPSLDRAILRAESPDGGRTWSSVTPTPLPNPGSGFAMLPLKEGVYLGVINYSFRDRSNLTLVLSPDGGKTWQNLQVLEEGPGREFSYPFLLRHGRNFHLTYTYQRQRIKHVVFNEVWLKGLEKHGN